MIIKQAVILAGGRGKRLRPHTDSIPKPMIMMTGKPFLEHLIELLKENGIEEVVLLLGYKAQVVQNYFKDGENFGVKIKYSVGDESYETGKRIKNAQSLLNENFLLMYCDNYYPLNLKKLTKFHEEHNSLLTMTVYSNKDKFTKNNTLVVEGLVRNYDKSRTETNLNAVEIGFFVTNKKLLDYLPNENVGLFEIFPKLIEDKQISAYVTDHRYYSIGKIERLQITEDYLKDKKIIFLDRDGVINVRAPKGDYIKRWKDFEFLPNVKKAISMLTKEGYKIFIITNQAGIGRGMYTEEDLEGIHHNMVKEIESAGGKISNIYYCPHNWDEGCDCRKPKPGMLIQAARENNINLRKAIFIGDDERDIMAGNAADVKSILLEGNLDLMAATQSIISDKTKNLTEFSKSSRMKIIEKEINGVYEITLSPREDMRGFFMRTYDKKLFETIGMDKDWVQENHSFSKKKGTIRGLHFQYPPDGENKIVRVSQGEMFFVVVDLRKNSETFGKWMHVILSADKKNLLIVPRGCATGNCTLTDNSDLLYKFDNYYAPHNEESIIWNDPDININWPTQRPSEISDRDSNGISYKEFLKKSYGGLLP